MAFLKKRRKNLEKEVYSTDEIYVLKTIVIIKKTNENKRGKQYATLYILASKKKNVYYEFFTARKIERELHMHVNEYACYDFTVVYIEDVKSITEYSAKQLKRDELCDCIVQINRTQ